LRGDVDELACTWGPDFHFPLSRVIAILAAENDAAHRTFLLGQEKLRDVLVAPASFSHILSWLVRLVKKTRDQQQNKVGISLSGGAMEGFLYQVGCCLALEFAMTGRSLYESNYFSGISSGSMVASAFAKNIPLIEIARTIHGKSMMIPEFKGSDLYDFAMIDILKRITRQSMRWSGLDLDKWRDKVSRSVPTGLFRGERLRSYIQDSIAAFGGEDSFADLDGRLLLGATHQDSFNHVVLGLPPWNDITVSDAVRASCALPPFFTPTTLKGVNFIDGQISRTSHLDLLIGQGCNLVFIIDPMKPYAERIPEGVDALGGIYTLIQTVKTLVYTRSQTVFSHMTEKYPDVDFLVFQPYDDCAEAMSGMPMRYRISPKIVDLAFKGTLRRLRERHHVYKVKLAKYGFSLISPQLLMRLEREGIPI
jgi:predicted acylesterase/phospholipase RssA